MSMRVNQNILSLQSYHALGNTYSRLEKSVQKLSSGLRINSAADDASGLAISEKMRRQVRGLQRAGLNAQDGISLLQVAEGALGEAQNILQRMRELAIQASNDTLTTNDRLELQREVAQLRSDLNRIAYGTEFNTKKLLDGTTAAITSSSSNYSNAIITGQPKDVNGEYDVSLTLLRAGCAEIQRSNVFTIKDPPVGLANGSTQLQSITQFYNNDDVFILGTPQVLNIAGNAHSTTIYLDGQMTLDDLSAAIQTAIVGDSGLGLKGSTCFLTSTAQTKLANVGGYMEILSGSIGEYGEITFGGDQKLIDALGLGVIRASTRNQVLVTSVDSFGNVKQVRTESGVASGLLEGIDIAFNSTPAQISGRSGVEAGVNFTAQETFDITIGGSVVNISTKKGYWSMEGLVRNYNEQIQAAINNPLNPQNHLNGLEARIVDGEMRFIYTRPLTASSTLDTSIYVSNNTNNQGGTLGILNGTYSGFVDGEKLTDNIVWGFSKFTNKTTDTTFIFKISVSCGLNSATIEVMTAQTMLNLDTPDLVRFDEFQARVNKELEKLSVRVRVDQVGGAMAFTSLRIGSQHYDGGPSVNSVVSVREDSNPLSDPTGLTNDWMFSMGMKPGTSRGRGDMNFRMTIIENTPHFQIGADEGQSMVVGIRDMSTQALGIDNVDITTVRSAQRALSRLNKAIDIVSSERARIGVSQNRLEFTMSNLRVMGSNLTSAESRIRDADIALEMMEFTRNQIVSQSATAMMAHANSIPQTVLQLLQ